MPPAGRWRGRWLLLLFLLLPPDSAGSAESSNPAAAERGVRVEQPVGKLFSQGSGIFLGDGVVLTAAHVVKADPANAKATVIVDGWRVDGKIGRAHV